MPWRGISSFGLIVSEREAMTLSSFCGAFFAVSVIIFSCVLYCCMKVFTMVCWIPVEPNSRERSEAFIMPFISSLLSISSALSMSVYVTLKRASSLSDICSSTCLRISFSSIFVTATGIALNTTSFSYIPENAILKKQPSIIGKAMSQKSMPF